MPIATSAYEHAYSDRRFWRKLRGHAAGAGRQALEKALWLYFAVQNPATPKWARRVIYGALGCSCCRWTPSPTWRRWWGTPTTSAS